MKISWYVQGGDKEEHLFDTEGQLPLEGSPVYVRDWREGAKERYLKYKVVHAYTNLVVLDTPKDRIPLTGYPANFNKDFAAYEKSMAPARVQLNLKSLRVDITTQEGQVILVVDSPKNEQDAVQPCECCGTRDTMNPGDKQCEACAEEWDKLNK